MALIPGRGTPEGGGAGAGAGTGAGAGAGAGGAGAGAAAGGAGAGAGAGVPPFGSSFLASSVLVSPPSSVFVALEGGSNEQDIQRYHPNVTLVSVDNENVRFKQISALAYLRS